MSIGSKKIRINIIMAIAHIPNIVNTSFWLISILFFYLLLFLCKKLSRILLCCIFIIIFVQNFYLRIHSYLYFIKKFRESLQKFVTFLKQNSP